uniref:cytochrome c oxidase subunit III n=1 Tax=Polymesoda caroliniana TaxID=98308 RepID=UPI002A824E83|nr:cytochrome c oxidase subunit III [Polymesoda caroliniana]WOV69030.1 cytochrome c oxidase subunit III [Polymesoda caroliniana]
MARTGYHLVDPSPWPFTASLSGLGLTSSLVVFFHEGLSYKCVVFLMCGFFLLVLTAFRWWGDLVVESTYLGHHTKLVVFNLYYGFWLFVLSEACLFLSFFWAFLYFGIGELSQQGFGYWPPLGVKTINPWKVALLNTAVLVGSGFFVNWAHRAVKAHGKSPLSPPYRKTKKQRMWSLNESVTSLRWRKHGLISLGVTILLGIFFTLLQATEYYMVSYTMADSAFGSAFFILTGFHGAHVIAGTVFLTVCWFRLYYFHFSYRHHHFGMYAATMYWHFVDAIWIFVYFIVYIWGR